MSNSMKIKRRLPDAPEPTRAAYKKPVIGEGKYIKVLPSVYKPKPAPIPKPRPKQEKKPKANPMANPYRKPRIWSNDMEARLIALYEEGKTYTEIAECLGKSKGTIGGMISMLASAGKIERRQPHGLWTEEDLRLMKQMREDGKSFGEISDKLGRSYKSCAEQYRRVYG